MGGIEMMNEAKEIVEITLRNLPDLGLTVDDVDLSGAEELARREDLVRFVERRIRAAQKSKKPYKWQPPPRRLYIDRLGRRSTIAHPHAASMRERMQNHTLCYRPRWAASKGS